MSLLTHAQLERIEKRYAQGISSADIVSIFEKAKASVSEASLRKYVQLRLVPKSERVALGKSRRGSAGLYPVRSVRMINDIKQALKDGDTLEGLQASPRAVLQEVEALEAEASRLMQRAQKHVPRGAAAARPKKHLEAGKAALEKFSRALRAALEASG